MADTTLAAEIMETIRRKAANVEAILAQPEHGNRDDLRGQLRAYTSLIDLYSEVA